MKRCAPVELPVVRDRNLIFAGRAVCHFQGIGRRRNRWRTCRVQITLRFYACCLLLDGTKRFVESRTPYRDASYKLKVGKLHSDYACGLT